MLLDSEKIKLLFREIGENTITGNQAVKLIDLTFTETAASENEAEKLFEELWKLYPNKHGKSAVTTKAKKELLKAGKEKVVHNLNVYMKNKEDWRPWLDGSTFFNGRWKDFDTVPEVKAKEVKKNNFTERSYDEAFLNSFIGGK